MKLNKSLIKTTFREIRQSFGRFASIACIIALGVGFFSGLKTARPDMLATAEEYLSEQNFFDFRLISTLGFDEESVFQAENKSFVSAAEGAIFADVLFSSEKGEQVYTVRSLPGQINTLRLSAGRLAEADGECVADDRYFRESDIGKTLTVQGDNPLKNSELTVVGLASSPLYLNYERGTTALGNGTVSAFLYLPQSGFQDPTFTELYLKLSEDYPLYSDEYEQNILQKKAQASSLCDRISSDRYDRIQTTAENELSQNRAEYQKNADRFEAEKKAAEEELKQAEEKIAAEKQTLVSGREEYAASLEEYRAGKEKVETARRQLNEGLLQLQTGIDSASAALEEGQRALSEAMNRVDRGLSEAGNAPSLSGEEQKTLDELKTEVDSLRKQIENGGGEASSFPSFVPPADFSQGVREVTEGIKSAAAAFLQVQAAQNTLASLNQQKQNLQITDQLLSSQEAELAKAEKSLESAKKQIEEGQEKLNRAEEDLSKAKSEAEEKFALAEKELSSAEEALAQAEQQLNRLSLPDTYTLGRDSNIGYVCFESDSSIVDGLAEIFPLFFFLVAAMMCMTTMIRMVDEQRSEIGVLKALGYSRGAVMAKYLTYSGLAAIVGCVIGFFAGSALFPLAIWAAYSMLYGFAPITLQWNGTIFFGTLAVSLLCTIGTTFAACHGEMAACAAEILRPKAPKSGKRTFLERFRFFGRLKFLQKVSLRNIARYKQRFWMMVLGVGGCTALLITGFGLRDSIQKLADYQYGEILLYDFEADLRSEMSASEREEFLAGLEGVESSLFASQASYEVQTSGGTRSAYVVAPENRENTSSFFCLKDGETSLSYPETGCAVVTRKFAESCGISPGDEITVFDSAHRAAVLTVSGICENYVYHYIYTDLESLSSGWGEAPPVKRVYLNASPGSDIHSAAADILNQDKVANLTVSADLRQRVSNMLSCLDYIVILLTLCAGALAFVVIYNLTNINITERIREIATIKVLGFYPKETAAYVFGENLVLTVFGALLGLGMGKALHWFVLSRINIDIVSFQVRIAVVSYLVSVLLTFVFSAAVDFFMFFKLQKIDMARSLKSIE